MGEPQAASPTFFVNFPLRLSLLCFHHFLAARGGGNSVTGFQESLIHYTEQ
jgi:hypothetical protein